jgi:hypothetical protein
MDKLDKALKALPGLIASAYLVLSHLSGTGLGHEKWEVQTQHAAGFIGIILSIFIAVRYGLSTRTVKKKLLLRSVAILVVMLVIDIGAGLFQSLFATQAFFIFVFRDVLWRIIYLIFCISILVCIACLAVQIPNWSANNDGGDQNNNNAQNDNN